MHIAVFTTFAASRKEPLVEMLERVHAGFVASGLGEPRISFALSDPPGTAETSLVSAALGIKRVSSVERVQKRWPELKGFVHERKAASAGQFSGRVISNAKDGKAVDFAILREIARGVPKSFPFHGARFHFSVPGFSEGPEFPAVPDRQTLSTLMRAGVDIGAGHPTSPGVSVQDFWWVNGRQRSLSAMRIVEADPAAKKLAPLPPAVASVFAACGKVRKTIQLPTMFSPQAPQAPQPPDAATISPSSATGEAVRSIVRAWRARIGEYVERLPHDLPHQPDAAETTSASGPRKPALVHAFAPMGYDCRGETGTFILSRRTAGNLTVRLSLDVGTWSNSLMAFFKVEGLVDGKAFKATLNLPASRHAARGIVHGQELCGQFPIGGPERWSKIVDNLAALVAMLDKSFVPEIETAAGPAPEWYRPETV
ncbi:MAG TPA: hypothetical protein VGI20_11740 [Rhizomicrobium sp.]